jgi:hypothetical protein
MFIKVSKFSFDLARDPAIMALIRRGNSHFVLLLSSSAQVCQLIPAGISFEDFFPINILHQLKFIQ